MSRPEHEVYDVLISIIGKEYFIFAQVHLSTLVHDINDRYGAFRHIDEKSVDFVLCDKAYISVKLAIELDDKTHKNPKRQERDKEVERILKEAGVPLLRLENHGYFNQNELSQKIKNILTDKTHNMQ